LDDACLKDKQRWDEAVARLRGRGLNISKELNVIGVVAGTVPESRIPTLEGDPCVVKVEPDERRYTR
jgi:hypothetical protein